MSAQTLKGKTLFITGASRGIGLAIGLRAARDGANVAIAAKTSEPNPKLPGTIYSAGNEIEAAGGRALPLIVDVRDEAAVRGALEETAKHFGGIDIVVNNASAISLTNSQKTEMKRFDLMHQINARGTFMVSKFAVSLVVLGLAGELRAQGIAVNALWPRTPIATAAVKNLLGGDALMRASRKPEILADAAHIIFCKEARAFTGQFLIDDTFLAQNGVTDFDPYRVDPSQALAVDFFVPDDSLAPASLAAVTGAKG
jgi:citronellol/citronellal dehydrogenase